METQVKSITKPASNGESVSRAMGDARWLQVGGVHFEQGTKLPRIGKELMK